MKLGLVIHKGRALYGHSHGLMLPMPVTDCIVRVWNHVACRLLGHDDILWHLKEADDQFPGPVECTNCLAPLTGCVGRHTD